MFSRPESRHQSAGHRSWMTFSARTGKVDEDGDQWHVTGLKVGEVAERMGIARSAVRWYADQDLLPCEHTSNNERRFFCRRPLPGGHDPSRPTSRPDPRRDPRRSVRITPRSDTVARGLEPSRRPTARSARRTNRPALRHPRSIHAPGESPHHEPKPNGLLRRRQAQRTTVSITVSRSASG